ncbi:hypothetical protein [Sanguibacter antarcticus]|uniref:Uncharacterized protein n=1 Tax=Sanguibacter antarcticus TaxID=372484 RepID=A0A2A9E832_9MICO|nr:hypothetical protein [Sanguibacter antarcticus]PFG34806.1 hypothetical protein ATL42_2730 [Sanguibacter antarcticus]
MTNEAADSSGATDTWLGMYPDVESFEVSGEGNKVIELPAGAWAGTVTASFDGDGPASLWPMDDTGAPTGTMVRTTAPYTGTTAFGLDGAEDTRALSLQFDGSWTLSVSSLLEAPELTEATTGDGDAVFLNHAHGMVDMTFPGDGDFNVTAYSEYAAPAVVLGFLPLYDIGEIVSGSTQTRAVDLDQDARIVTIHSTGPWRVATTS